MTFTPRDYQQRSIDVGINNLFNGGGVRNGLILLPTGTGKSVVIGGTVNRIKELYPPARIVMLTHVKELVEQNYNKAVAMTSHPIGLWSAGLRKKDYHEDIVFAGIDTVQRNPYLLAERHIVLIDEAHRVSPKLGTNYRYVIEDTLAKINPNVMTLGYTATDHRLGQGLLTDSWLDRKNNEEVRPFWDDVLLDLTSTEEFNKFFVEGYLKRLVPKATNSEIDVTNLRKRDGEYVQADVDAAVNNAAKIRSIVDEICEQGFDRRSWLVFAAGNKNAELIATEIASRGVVTAVLTEKTPKAERDRIIAAYKNYEIRCLVNNDILTTGFDHEGVDLIAVVRVTASTALWVQMLGRGTRPVYAKGFDLTTQDGRLASIFASGVYNCMVLDFAGNSKRLGTINNPVKPTKPQKNNKAQAGDCPVKICGYCGAYNSAVARYCENEMCGKEFLMSADIVDSASKRELIDEKEHIPDIRKMTVTSVTFKERKIFTAGGGQVSDIVCTYGCGKHGKFTDNLRFTGATTKGKSLAWWLHFGDGTECPRSNEAFLLHYASSRIKRLRVLEVYVNPPRKTRPEIKYYGFDDASFYATENGDA